MYCLCGMLFCLVFNVLIAHFGLLFRTNNIYRLDCLGEIVVSSRFG